MLFEVAIIEKPTKSEIEQGKSERIVLAPTAVCAKDRDAAIVAATLAANATQSPGPISDPARTEVLVRPFC